jgi:hypothetical protein
MTAPTCLGSPGAARVMLAAEQCEWGVLVWGVLVWQLPGDSELLFNPYWRRTEWWRLNGHPISRDTARLLLRGLLAPGMLEEVRGWVDLAAEADGREFREATNPHDVRRRDAAMRGTVWTAVLAKLDEVTK